MLKTEMQASETNHLNAALKLNYKLPYWYLIILNNIFQYISVYIYIFVCNKTNEFVCVYTK